MCNCWSYNMQEGELPNVILDPNKYFNWDSEASSVCVDHCIASQIRLLWKNGIWTRGSCCGHGSERPSVIIAGSEEPEEVIRILNKHDPERDWLILQWQLVNVKTSEDFYG